MDISELVGCTVEQLCWHLIVTFELKYHTTFEMEYFDDCVIVKVCEGIDTLHYSNLHLLWGSDAEKVIYERH